jgi:threonyl-tRNA synthetase
MVFWHSSAHILGEACEQEFNCHLCIGPPLKEGGFYYEMGDMPRGPVIPARDFPLLNAKSKKIVGEKQPFERLVISKPDLLEMFKVC